MIHHLKKLILVVALLGLLSGCADTNGAFVKNNDTVSQVQQNIQRNNEDQLASQPAVVEHSGYYADTNPISLSNNPDWFSNPIRIHGRDVTLSFLLSRILRNTPATVDYQADMNPGKTLSVDYNGTIKGALELLAAKTNYAYTVNGDQLAWSAFETKTFDISFMPGSSDYSVGQGSASTNTYNTNTNVSTLQANLSDDQYSNLKGSLSVWNDLTTTLNQLKSKTGTVEVSQATTSVTVHDHPANVAAIANYIKQLNQRLSRQVLLVIKVLQIDLNEDHQFGIDWGLAGKVVSNLLKTHYSFNTGGVSTSLSLAQASSATSNINLPSLQIGATGGSNAIIRALGQQGKLSIVTEPRVTTLNNQVAEIRIHTDTSYLAKVEATVTPGTTPTQNTISTTLTPGVVTDGFTLYILPKIQGNKVFLQVSSVIATLKSITSVTANGDNTGDQIQIPTLSEKRFNIRSLVENKGTLVVAGFKQLENATKDEKIFGSSTLGGRSAAEDNVQTIILITPTIIENQS